MYPSKKELLNEIDKYNSLYSLEKYKIKRKLFKIPKDKIVFYFCKSDDFNFWVKEYYSRSADKVEIIDNVLKHDHTVNYKATYNINRVEDIFNMHILNNYNNYFSIKNISIQNILAIASHSQLYKNSMFHNLNITKEVETINMLLQEKKLPLDILVKKLYKKYLQENETYNALIDLICWNYQTKYFKNPMIPVEKAYKKRNMILHEILDLPLNIKLKNTSELTLYKIVKDLYPDSIYQHRTAWLGKQSIDIYIPSKKIAIEYQGEQHYKPIKIYNGNEGFEKRKELDHRKRNLLKEHNICLLEWKYDEQISTENLLKKLNVIGDKECGENVAKVKNA